MSLQQIPGHYVITAPGSVDSATCSAIASAYAESAASGKLDSTASSSFYPADNPSGFISSVDLSDYATTAYVDSSISGFAYNSAVSGWTAKQDQLTYGYNTADQISSIDGSALGGMDEAAVSAIASSYAESAASSKQDMLTFGYNAANQISSIDGSALGGMDEAAVSGIASAYAESAVSAASSNYYPATSNPSGYLTAQAQASWSESASASPSYIVDKPDLVDIVAGPGIVVDNPDGNTLRVSMAADYEVTLWEGGKCNGQITLSESPLNFEYIAVYAQAKNPIGSDGFQYGNFGQFYTRMLSKTLKNQDAFVDFVHMDGNNTTTAFTWYSLTTKWSGASTTTWTWCRSELNGNSVNDWYYMLRIVGIHRISGGN